MKKSKSLYWFLVVFMLFTACSKSVAERSINTSNTDKKLVIAAVQSDFKQALLDKIVEKYSSKAEIDIISLKQLLKRIQHEDYDALLIMDACQAWMAFNRKTKKILNMIHEKNKVVLYVSAGDPGWKYSYKDFDAITSASEEKYKQRVLGEITSCLDNILSPGPAGK